MAPQEELQAEIQPFLSDGELFRAAFTMQAGRHPLWTGTIGPIASIFNKRRMVIVTNLGVHLCSIKGLSGHVPKKTLEHYPLGTHLVCGTGGRHSKFFVGGTRYWIHRRELDNAARSYRVSIQLANAQSDCEAA